MRKGSSSTASPSNGREGKAPSDRSTDVRPEPADTSSDILDSSLDLEEAHFREGYSDGHRHGVAAGREEGRQVGLKTGFETGEEVGLYRGCVGVRGSAIRADPTRYSARVQKSVRTMEALLDGHPTTEPEDELVQEMVGDLRLKSRAVRASLGAKLENRGYLKGVDNEDVEF
ncbi:protein LTO1 homolog [Eucalyptus grandis]|uniref:protein LTO1 homolog n=1 Tax=Eucalyptus grandis TaxID=71139 RepID=UPI00192EEDBB|nr:protein LTO1 homolog [Eucalyptus grandis]